MVLFEVLSWAGASTCYIWDCHHAGRLIQSAHQEAAEIDRQLTAAALQNPEIAQAHPPVYAKRQIHFAACGPNERIPKIHGMPDDLFTICLLTPLKIALLHHNNQTFPLSSLDSSKQRSRAYMEELWENMSPDLKGRLWCELVAILHTIAWQSMDGAMYQRIFGQSGQSISQLAAGFLMSQRVLGAYNVKPESIPSIPSSTSHSLWVTWDLILENFFEQLPDFFDQDTHPEWEAKIHMLSFMEDQLESILTSNQALIGSYKAEDNIQIAIGKLPIICQAAVTRPLRPQACNALDACLAKLGPKALVLAIQCGALEVALDLLDLHEPNIADVVISIWASLIKHEGAMRRLAEPVKKAAYLSDVKAVVFFLHHLEAGLDDGENVKAVECAAILCTIINYIPKREAPKFFLRALNLAMRMLDQQIGLIRQWGALLSAELLHGIVLDREGDREVLQALQSSLMALVNDRTVETRAAMLYALQWWFSPYPTADLVESQSSLELIDRLLSQAETDAAIQVRQEMQILLYHTLAGVGKWAPIGVWLYQAQQAAMQLRKRGAEIVSVVKLLKEVVGIDNTNLRFVQILMKVARMLTIYSQDPEASVSRLSKECIAKCQQTAGGVWRFDKVSETWDDCSVDVLLEAGRCLAKGWKTAEVEVFAIRDVRANQNLFKTSRMSLRAYLTVSHAPRSTIPGANTQSTQVPSQKELFSKEKDMTWILRHRVLEDSIVLAEQHGESSLEVIG